MTADQATERQAAAANCNAELLRELELAHKITTNCMLLMSPCQLRILAERNDHQGLLGELDVARSKERSALITKLTGSAA